MYPPSFPRRADARGLFPFFLPLMAAGSKSTLVEVIGAAFFFPFLARQYGIDIHEDSLLPFVGDVVTVEILRLRPKKCFLFFLPPFLPLTHHHEGSLFPSPSRIRGPSYRTNPPLPFLFLSR